MPRVLIVDDQRIPRITVGAALQEAGHEVITAEDGPSGIDRARAWAPDVIVLDVHMPGMDGFAVVERLKEDPVTAPIPVIFLTATAPTDELVVRGLDLGAYDFLSKGCSKAELLARVGVMTRIKRSNDELTAIARIADALIRSLDPEALSHLFVEQTREVFRAEAVLFVTTPDDSTTRLTTRTGFDLPPPEVEALTSTLLTWLERNSSEAEVISLDELREAGPALMRQKGFRSAVAVRFDHPERSPTLLAVFAQRAGGFRRESDAPLLHLLGRQATIALDNALLHAHTRKQAQTLARQAEELENAMSERSRFFASMSHELRTPINAVIGYSQLLEEGTYGEMPRVQQEVIKKVSRSAAHLLELINDVLDISKIEAGKLEIMLEPTDIEKLAKDTLTSVQLQAEEKRLNLSLHSPASVRVDTDPARVRQILLNLLSNAVKFTDHGSVTVTVQQVGSADMDSSRDGVEIRVADTGPGIPPEDRARIFDEFEQTDTAVNRGGTGLGLAISKRLAILLGGSLTLDSEVGVGSTFILRIPREHRGSASSTGHSAAAPEVATH
jgi:signal transduction histidine kinase/DNA-binding response OmpR family regulator